MDKDGKSLIFVKTSVKRLEYKIDLNATFGELKKMVEDDLKTSVILLFSTKVVEGQKKLIDYNVQHESTIAALMKDEKLDKNDSIVRIVNRISETKMWTVKVIEDDLMMNVPGDTKIKDLKLTIVNLTKEEPRSLWFYEIVMPDDHLVEMYENPLFVSRNKVPRFPSEKRIEICSEKTLSVDIQNKVILEEFNMVIDLLYKNAKDNNIIVNKDLSSEELNDYIWFWDGPVINRFKSIHKAYLKYCIELNKGIPEFNMDTFIRIVNLTKDPITKINISSDLASLQEKMLENKRNIVNLKLKRRLCFKVADVMLKLVFLIIAGIIASRV